MSYFEIVEQLPVEDLTKLWGTLLDALPNGVVITRSRPPDHPVVYVNPAFEELTGYGLDEVRGRDLRFLQGDDTSQPGVVELRKALSAGRRTRALLRNYTKDGRLFWNEMVVAPLPGEDDSPEYFLGVLEDRTAFRSAGETRRPKTGLESVEALRQVADQLNLAVWLLDRASGTPDSTRLVYCNPGFTQLWGTSPAEEVGGWLTAIHPDDRRRAATLLPTDADQAHETRQAEFRLGNRALGDEEHWLKGRSFPILDDGQPVRRVVLARDVTEHHQVEEELRRANQALANTVQELAQRNLQMLALNETVDHLQNCSTSEEAEQAVAECVPEIFRREAGAVYLLAEEDSTLQPLVVWGDSPPRDETFPIEHCEALRRGREFWTEASFPPVRCRHGRPAQGVSELCLALRSHGSALGLLHLRVIVGESPEEQEVKASALRFAINVAEQIALGLSNIRLRERLHVQAVEDPLTGLYNRRFFNDALERELRRAVRRDSPLSLLMLDLDHFKRVNDRWGHEAGDRLLQRLAGLLRTSVRAEDVVARYGGEEFMILLPDTDLPSARLLAERLRETFREQEGSLGPAETPPVTLSVGVAGRPESGQTAEALLRAADTALYRAKRHGRDRVEILSTFAEPPSSA